MIPEDVLEDILIVLAVLLIVAIAFLALAGLGARIAYKRQRVVARRRKT